MITTITTNNHPKNAKPSQHTSVMTDEVTSTANATMMNGPYPTPNLLDMDIDAAHRTCTVSDMFNNCKMEEQQQIEHQTPIAVDLQ
jgi:hypothetical protein